MFDPDRTDQVFRQDALSRAESLATDKATNYGVVRLELIQKICSAMYMYRAKGLREPEWPHQLLTNRVLTNMTESQNGTGQTSFRLQMQNHSDALLGKQPRMEELDVDLVIVACG